MTMNKKFISMQVQCKSDNDCRSFVSCSDSLGVEWELRGYGTSVVDAAESGMSRFDDDEMYWDIYGYRVH